MESSFPESQIIQFVKIPWIFRRLIPAQLEVDGIKFPLTTNHRYPFGYQILWTLQIAIGLFWIYQNQSVGGRNKQINNLDGFQNIHS
jgi:hypothetical protein